MKRKVNQQPVLFSSGTENASYFCTIVDGCKSVYLKQGPRSGGGGKKGRNPI